MNRILTIGSSGRLDCLLDILNRSLQPKELFAISTNDNESIREKCEDVLIKSDLKDFKSMADYASYIKADFAIIGPEEPLVNGIVNHLEATGFPCVGPSKVAAKLEGSKGYTRFISWRTNLHKLNPKYQEFTNTYFCQETKEVRDVELKKLHEYFYKLGNYVIKPDGLTGGKGVVVKGEHFQTDIEAEEIFFDYIKNHKSVLIEEKLLGEEFSLITFSDGITHLHTFPVQDHKRAYNFDEGPNTGGMGSYSLENHSLPFLSSEDVEYAKNANEEVLNVLSDITSYSNRFKGFLYGGFIKTAHGIKLLEYNVRFGDPEISNILPILKTDFIEVCKAIITRSLKNIKLEFEDKATVCKYIVPNSYPERKDMGKIIENVPRQTNNLKVYFSSVKTIDSNSNKHELLGSRAIMMVGIGDILEEARIIADNACNSIIGPIRYRSDIGTQEQIQRRINHMKEILNPIK